MALQSYVFFGPANRLHEDVKARRYTEAFREPGDVDIRDFVGAQIARDPV